MRVVRTVGRSRIAILKRHQTSVRRLFLVGADNSFMTDMERFLFGDLVLPAFPPQSLSYLTYEIGLRTHETLLAELRTRRRMEAARRTALNGEVRGDLRGVRSFFAEW